eukprot:scpid69312/ scgid5921/ 
MQELDTSSTSRSVQASGQSELSTSGSTSTVHIPASDANTAATELVFVGQDSACTNVVMSMPDVSGIPSAATGATGPAARDLDRNNVPAEQRKQQQPGAGVGVSTDLRLAVSSSDTGTNPRQSSVSSPYDVGRQQITQNTTSTSTPVSSAGYTNTTRTNDDRTFTITAATPTLQYGTTTTPTQQHSLSSARTLTASGTKFAQGFGTATDPASAYGGSAASASASFGAHSHLAPASASTIPYGSRVPLDELGVPQLQEAQSQTPQWTQPDTAASQWPPPCSTTTTPNLAGSTQWSDSPVPPAAVSSNNAAFGVQRIQTRYNVSGLYPSPALHPPVNAAFGGSPAQNGSALYPGQQSASNYGPYGGTP